MKRSFEDADFTSFVLSDKLAERAQALETARRRWRTEVIKHPKVLYAYLGPQIRCEVEGQSAILIALGKAAPLSFDVNTAEEGIIQMIPGITDSQVKIRLIAPSCPSSGILPRQWQCFEQPHGLIVSI
jgi:hypothetical protein